MYLTIEGALAEIVRLDVQIAEHEAALKAMFAKRKILIEQTAPPRRSKAAMPLEQRVARWEAILRLRVSGCSIARVSKMLRCAASQEIAAVGRFLKRPANANHPLQVLAKEAASVSARRTQ